MYMQRILFIHTTTTTQHVWPKNRDHTPTLRHTFKQTPPPTHQHTTTQHITEPCTSTSLSPLLLYFTTHSISPTHTHTRTHRHTPTPHTHKSYNTPTRHLHFFQHACYMFTCFRTHHHRYNPTANSLQSTTYYLCYTSTLYAYPYKRTQIGGCVELLLLLLLLVVVVVVVVVVVIFRCCCWSSSSIAPRKPP